METKTNQIRFSEAELTALRMLVPNIVQSFETKTGKDKEQAEDFLKKLHKSMQSKNEKFVEKEAKKSLFYLVAYCMAKGDKSVLEIIQSLKTDFEKTEINQNTVHRIFGMVSDFQSAYADYKESQQPAKIEKK